MTGPETTPRNGEQLPHARTRLDRWAAAWKEAGELILLLDFDGTLAPIVERPELAAMPAATRDALERLLSCRGLRAAVVSGRGMHDARERAALPGVAYAGNHGMEIEGPSVRRIHEEAAAARPALERARDAVAAAVQGLPGALVEDKGLTLSIHYRQVDRARVDEVKHAVAAATTAEDSLRVTSGKEVLEIRPAVEWDKGRAVEFLLEHYRPARGAPVLYLGDDTTDEDAFQALERWGGGAGEGVIVADPLPQGTAARCYVRSPEEVGALLEDLAARAP